jgi:hypothetical protein
MPPDDQRRRELVAVIIRAVIMVLRALDRYFETGVFRQQKK